MGTLYSAWHPSQRLQAFDELLPRHRCMIQAKTCIGNHVDVIIDIALITGFTSSR